MSSTCLPLHCAHNHSVGREDRAMLRSNLSARVDAEAWAATFLSLLIFALHALASIALNLIVPQFRTSPNLESPRLPNGKIYRGAFPFRDWSGGTALRTEPPAIGRNASSVQSASRHERAKLQRADETSAPLSTSRQ